MLKQNTKPAVLFKVYSRKSDFVLQWYHLIFVRIKRFVLIIFQKLKSQRRKILFQPDEASVGRLIMISFQEQYPLSVIFPLLKAAKNDIVYFTCLSKFVLNVYIKSTSVVDRQVIMRCIYQISSFFYLSYRPINHIRGKTLIFVLCSSSYIVLTS